MQTSIVGFGIDKATRNRLILSAVFLIFTHLESYLDFMIIIKWDIFKEITFRVLIILSTVYIYLVIAKYFSFYSAEVLVKCTYLLLGIEVGQEVVNSMTTYFLLLPDYILGVFNALFWIVTLVWIILVLASKSEDNGLKALKNYAISIIVTVFIGIVLISLVVLAYIQQDALILVPSALPYFFIIQFALRIYQPNKNSQDIPLQNSPDA